MAGTASISVRVINSTTIDCIYSCNITGSGRQGLIDIVDDPRVQFPPGSPLRYYLGAGAKSGTIRYTSYWPNRLYHFYIYDYKNQSDYTRLGSASARTPSPSPPPPPTPSGTLSGDVTAPTTIDLNYTYINGTSVSLFRDSDLVITFGSGNGAGVYNDTGLAPDTEFTYTLRNGTTIGSALLATAILGTPVLPAVGTLSAGTIDEATIDLTYTFIDGTEVSLFRDGARVTTFGSGTGGGVYRDTGLAPDTEFVYDLRDGSSVGDALLATSTTSTLKTAKKAIIARGKILPLNSLLTIFDSTLKPLGVLEDYEYLNWVFRFRKPGNFKLIINRYKSNVEYLVKGNVLAIYVAGYYRAGIIESIEIGLTEEGKISENYVILGRGLGGLMAERIALHGTAAGTGYDSQNTDASTAMRYYVNINCMDADDANRNYPLLFLEDPDPSCGGNIKYDARFQYISELLEEISLASGVGWEIVLDPTNKKFIFQNIEGVDRSWDNGVNSAVSFSPKFGNIKLINYADSNMNSKNVAYVAGQGEANARDVDAVSYLSRLYTNDPASGDNIELDMADTSIFTVSDTVIVSSSAGSEQALITVVHTDTHITVDTLALNHTTTNPLVSTIYNSTDRREILIDARDLDATDKMLQRGNERLVELGETKVINIENLSTGPFSYGEDFYLGDIVTVNHPDIIEADVRIIESIIEISPENLIQNKLIFGKQFPDFIAINDLKNKNIYPEVRR